MVGIDPNPAELWPLTGGGQGVVAVLGHCRALIAAVAEAAVAVKLQLAWFERWGAAGLAALEELVGYAREEGLLVILDAKRGDVPHTAAAYAQALLGREGLDGDAATVSPWFGAEAVKPFLELAGGSGKGVFVVVRSSNPGGADLQELPLQGGGRVWERAAEIVRSLAKAGSGGELGAVVGATVPEAVAQARRLLGDLPILLPGVGAQGGAVEPLAAALADAPEPLRRSSLLITAARSLANAWRREGGDPRRAAEREAQRLRAAAWALG